MKKLLPFLFLSLFVLAGCKDDDEDDNPKSTTETLQGTWNVVSQKYEYYNAANAKVYEETDNSTGTTINFNGQNFQLSSLGFTIDGTYTTSESNGKKYLSTSILGATDTAEITNLSDNNMTWVSETLNDTYDENGVPKTAAKSITTVQLQKQP